MSPNKQKNFSLRSSQPIILIVINKNVPFPPLKNVMFGQTQCDPDIQVKPTIQIVIPNSFVLDKLVRPVIEF